MPVTKGDGSLREQMREAVGLLKEAGYELKDGVMAKAGQPLTFEILLVQENFVRVAQPFVKNLERLGIKATIRLVDSAQYVNRLNSFDFDMIVQSFGQSLSPGNEQVNYWASSRADMEGSGNMAGVKDPVVDALVEQIIKAPDRTSLVSRVHALDRVLLHGWYGIPQWHMSANRIAYWNRFGHPETPQKYGLGFPDTWWMDASKDSALKAAP
jgi:microcin C transport system substrate-binding protein